MVRHRARRGVDCSTSSTARRCPAAATSSSRARGHVWNTLSSSSCWTFTANRSTSTCSADPVNSDSMTGPVSSEVHRGRLPRRKPTGRRLRQRRPVALPTAEVPVTNMYRDEILLDDDLPVKHQAFSPNFRREAGEHGTETRGYVRVHQSTRWNSSTSSGPRTATTG